MKPPSIRSSKTVYRGFFDLRTDLLMRSDGELFDYTSLVLHADSAIIIAEDCEGRVVLNREYRHPTGEWVLGFPGGRLEKGEDPIAGGQRELYEETGYWSDDLTLLGSSYPIPSLAGQRVYFLHAKQAVNQGTRKLDPFEFIDIELKTYPELQQAIISGRHIDSMMCAALWYKSLAAC
jgi:ADP-ribose pyrophosphatase